VHWLLLSYRVPAQPSALRVATWRALKQAGAVLLGPGLYALPDSPEHQALLTEVTARVTSGGGTAITLRANGLTEDDERALALKFEGARHDDYRQVLKSARKFIAHVDQEDRDQDYRFAEVESLEEELNKVRRQLALVRDRDTLHMPLGAEATESVTAAETRLQQYLDHAYQQENVE
jgi:hypothetical protein